MDEVNKSRRNGNDDCKNRTYTDDERYRIWCANKDSDKKQMDDYVKYYLSKASMEQEPSGNELHDRINKRAKNEAGIFDNVEII